MDNLAQSIENSMFISKSYAQKNMMENTKKIDTLMFNFFK